jgi:NDP-sugar pyrophosphorylase family protein
MSSGPIDAIVMAGGKGTRLAPYTTVLPKPLMPLGDAPVLEYLLRKLRGHGIRRVCLAVNHLRHLIQAFFGDGHSLDLEIVYAVEDIPLGTCGPVAQVIDQMASHFVLLNGDLVTDLDVTAMLEHHNRSGAVATVAVKRLTSQLEFGVLETDEGDRVTRIREKPRTDYLINMGIYVLARDQIRQHLRAGEPLDMPQLLQVLMDAGQLVQAYQADCEWLDIGRPEEYARAQAMVESAPNGDNKLARCAS